MLAFEDLALPGDVLEPGRQRIATLDPRGDIGLDDARDADRRARASSRDADGVRHLGAGAGEQAFELPVGRIVDRVGELARASAAEFPRSAGILQMPPEEIEHRVLGFLVLDVGHVGRGVEHDTRRIDAVRVQAAPPPPPKWLISVAANGKPCWLVPAKIGAIEVPDQTAIACPR